MAKSTILPSIFKILGQGPLRPKEMLDALDHRGISFRVGQERQLRIRRLGTILAAQAKPGRKHPAKLRNDGGLYSLANGATPTKVWLARSTAHWQPKATGDGDCFLLRTSTDAQSVERCLIAQEMTLEGHRYILVRIT
jgi:hypothetical protein